MTLSPEYIRSQLLDAKPSYKPKQNRISIPVLVRMCKKMKHQIDFKPIHVSSEDIIVDGHHRYVAAVLTGYDLPIVENYPIPSNYTLYDWEEVEFVEEDWDTRANLRIYNEEDAVANDLSVKEIRKILQH